MLVRHSLLHRCAIDEEKRFVEEAKSAFGRGSATKLSHSQSPIPCRGVSLKICHSSFMLL
jgi:hypothetical protein